MTAVTSLKLPFRLRKTQGLLGLDQKDPKTVRLPEGLRVLEAGSFRNSEVEKVTIPSSVRELGNEAFQSCQKLCEVVFEPGS